MQCVEKWLWLSRALNEGTAKVKHLILHFETIDSLFSATASELKAVRCRLTAGELMRLSDKSLQEVQKIILECRKKDIRIIVPSDREYPERLWNISNPPTVLFAKGKPLDIDNRATVAVVGTRKASKNGAQTAKKFGAEISGCGGLVVTGLARGIDSEAAKGALDAGGDVIAVLGCGVDVCYPQENKKLFADVIKSGTILSEYPPGTRPNAGNFPCRNRIMSGISLGTVVIEAPERSGALITAARALEQNRDVFAAPSGVFESSAVGSNELIRAGAIPVMSGRDVMEEYRGRYGVEISVKSETPKQKAEAPKVFRFPDGFLDKFSGDDRVIMNSIAGEELRPDEIAEKSGLKVQKVLALLTLLEIRGALKQLPGGRFVINGKNE